MIVPFFTEELISKSISITPKKKLANETDVFLRTLLQFIRMQLPTYSK
jgi:hypothetical protein